MTEEDAALAQVWLLLDARRPHDALGAAQQALATNPGSAALTAAVGSALLQVGDIRGSQRWAEHALCLDPAIGWVHHLRACSLLDGGGPIRDARASAVEAVRLEPGNEWFLYTLVHANLAARDRRGAASAATTLCRTVPTSSLCPFAAALIAMDRARVLYRRRWRLWILLLATVVTSGGALAVIGVWWVAHAIRRAPHLRHADALLREALRRAPDSAHARLVAAEVLERRFRFVQSIDHRVAAAAIDSGFVDADALVADVARRQGWVVAGAAISWLLAAALVSTMTTSARAAAGLGLAAMLLAALSVLAGARIQTINLPPRLRGGVQARQLPVVAATIATSTVVLLAAVDGRMQATAQAAAGVALVGTVCSWVQVRRARARRAAPAASVSWRNQ